MVLNLSSLSRTGLEGGVSAGEELMDAKEMLMTDYKVWRSPGRMIGSVPHKHECTFIESGSSQGYSLSLMSAIDW